MAILIITHGNRTIRRELDDKHTIVGRDPGCDLFFADKRLSRQHAQFEATEAGVRLIDLDSRNGTWVNQTRIKEVMLGPDDTVRIGSLTVVLEAAEPAAQPIVHETPEIPEIPETPETPETMTSEMRTTARLPDEPDELELIDEDEEDGRDNEKGAPPAPEQAGTVMLKPEETAQPPAPSTAPLPRPAELTPATAKGDDDAAGTVMLQAPQAESLPAPSEPSKEDAAGTVMLSKAEGLPVPPTTPMPRPANLAPAKSDADDDAGTVMLSRTEPPAPESGDKTVMLSRDEPALPDTGTRAMSVQPPPDASPQESVVPETAMLPQNLLPQTGQLSGAPEIGAAPPLPTSEPAEAPKPGDGLKDRVSSWSWSFKLLLLALVLGFTVYFIVAWPLVRTLGSELREESLRRGRVLLSLVAATNAPLVGQERVREVSVDVAEREERVKEAFIINYDGNVLAPSSQSDKTMETIPGIDVPTKDIRTFYLGRRSGRDYVMVQPLVYRGSRVGVAVLVYEAAAGAGGWTTAILFLGLIVLLAAVGAVVVLGKKMTLVPLASLQDDVEAVVKGDSVYLPKDQAFQELSDLAESINRLIDRAPGLRASATKHEPPAGWSTPEPSAAPIPKSAPVEPVAPTPPPPTLEPEQALMTPAPVSSMPPPAATSQSPVGEGAKFWVDESFVVIRAEEEAYEIVGTAPGEMEGKHLIEAIKEQRVLEVVLDTINSLQSEPTAQGQADLETGSIRVTAAREATSVVVSLEKL